MFIANFNRKMFKYYTYCVICNAHMVLGIVRALILIPILIVHGAKAKNLGKDPRN
jgi:hypothetical protein